MKGDKLKALFPYGSFARNVSVLTGGTIFAQGFAVLILPILSRLYSPDDFSLLAVYAAIVGIVSVVSCLRFNIAIPLPEDDADGMVLLAISLVTTTVVSFVLALTVALAPAWTTAFVGQPELVGYLWMVPVGALLASGYDALQYWALRKHRFALVTRTRITRALGGLGTQAGFGFFGAPTFGLLFGHMLYSGLGIVGLLINIVRTDTSAILKLNWNRVRRQVIAYRDFPTWSVSEAFLNTLGAQVPIIIIAAQAIGPEAGFLMLAIRVVGMPMTLIGSSVSQVFLAEAPQQMRAGTLSGFTRRIMWLLFKRSLLPFFAIGAFSPILFPVVFGQEWARAGWIVAFMTPWSILEFTASPVMRFLHTIGKLRTAFLLQLYGFAVRVGSIFLAVRILPESQSHLTSIVFIASSFTFYATCILTVLLISKREVIQHEK